MTGPIHPKTAGQTMAIALLALACACGERMPANADEQGTSTPPPTAVQEELRHGDLIKALYEKAKAAGEQVPEDIMQWAKEDIAKIGAWQYRLVDVPSDRREDIEKTLNELGAQRWECFWVEKTADGRRLFMKKAERSYFQAAGKMAKFLPSPGGGE